MVGNWVAVSLGTGLLVGHMQLNSTVPTSPQILDIAHNDRLFAFAKHKSGELAKDPCTTATVRTNSFDCGLGEMLAEPDEANLWTEEAAYSLGAELGKQDDFFIQREGCQECVRVGYDFGRGDRKRKHQGTTCARG